MSLRDEIIANASVTDWLIGIGTVVIACFTILLARIGRRQSRDARILQRAYVIVAPRGISSTTNGELLGRVSFRNAGHLPAQQFRWILNVSTSNRLDWKPPQVDEDWLREEFVLPIMARVTRESPPLALVPEKWLYVWGRVTYRDGYNVRRFVDFCHRYNADATDTRPGNGYRIKKSKGRYHDYGNKAD